MHSWPTLLFLIECSHRNPFHAYCFSRLTDEAGHGVILTSSDDRNIVNFFFSRADANAALETLKNVHR